MKLDEFGEKAGAVIRENVAHIIFGAVIFCVVLLPFVQITSGDGKIDWVDMCINIVLQMSVFIPYRWRQKRISGTLDPYKANKVLYGEKVAEINANNRLELFGRFCEIKTEELKRTRQLQIVHAAGIDTERYDSGKFDGLNDKQKKAVEKAARVKVKPVNALCITSNSNHVKDYGIDFDETVEDAKSTIGKILPMLMWVIVLAYIALDALSYGGIIAIVMIVFRVIMCLSAMFSGIMSGEGFVIKKDRVIMRRIDFINLFNEWCAANCNQLHNEKQPIEETESTVS